MTTAKRSEFLGVYPTNPEAEYSKEVPFRVSMPLRKDGETEWINGGFFKTERTAARAYNMIAIQHLGKDAIVNDIGKPTKAMNDEFAQYLAGNPARAQSYKLTADKAKQLIAEYGKFQTHKDVRAAVPTTPEIDGVL